MNGFTQQEVLQILDRLNCDLPMYFDVDRSGRDPTSYEDLLIPEKDISEVLQWARRVVTDMAQGSYFSASAPIPEAISILGVYPLACEANAFSIKYDKGRYVLAINIGYHRFLEEILLILATAVHRAADSGELPSMTITWAQVELCKVVTRQITGKINLSSRVQGITGDFEEIKQMRNRFSTIAEYFVFCHEMAHISLGHCDSRIISVVGYGTSNSPLESYWKKEFDADAFATLQLFNKITSDIHFFTGTIYARPIIIMYFYAFELYHKAFLQTTDIDQNQLHLTHPSPEKRLNIVNKIIDGVFLCLLPELGYPEQKITDLKKVEQTTLNIAKSICNFDINVMVEMVLNG